uniref:Conotoxin-like unassigned superfamily 16 n=1 Tax=Conus ermineus TaxID=55423 RepID=A0A346CIY8_CONER|nr:conotoxin-like precursor unassigned superfamily 16 [Conus ermineus]
MSWNYTLNRKKSVFFHVVVSWKQIQNELDCKLDLMLSVDCFLSFLWQTCSSPSNCPTGQECCPDRVDEPEGFCTDDCVIH